MKLSFLKTIIVGFGIFVSCFAFDVSASLLSYWDLNGNADDRLNTNHGAAFGVTWAADNPGRAYSESAHFSGSDYIALDQSFQGKNLSSVSASAWFKTTATGNWSSNWALLDFDRSEFFNMFVAGDGSIGFSTRGDTLNDMYSQITGLNDGEWHHVAVTYSASEGKNIYVDGVLDSKRAYDGVLGTSQLRYGFIGDGSEASSYNGARNNLYYDGLISEVKLWDHALTASEVRAEVPEPSAIALFALGIFGLRLLRSNSHF